MKKMKLRQAVIVSVTLLLTGCGGLTRYSATPDSTDEKLIPGGGKDKTYGSLLISNIREDKEAYVYFLSHGGKADNYYDIAAYYRNPQIKYNLDISGTSMPGVPFIPLPTAKIVRSGGDYNEIYVGVKGVIDASGLMRYTLPAYDSKFKLKRLELNNRALSPQIFLIEKEPTDGAGWDGIYGWVDLLYPNLVLSSDKPCPQHSSLNLSPYDVVATHTNGYHFTRAFWDKHKANYLSDPANVLHIDLTQSKVCLVPQKGDRNNTNE